MAWRSEGPVLVAIRRAALRGEQHPRDHLSPLHSSELRSLIKRKNKNMATVRIPTPLRTLTGGEDQVQALGDTVKDVIENLEKNHPGIRERLLDDKGVRRFVNIYVGDEDIRFLDGLATPLKATDEISIVPAIAGG